MKITAEETINAPIEKVFEVFSDIGKIEERITDIVKSEILSDTKEGLGTRWRETRVMFGKEATEEMEITGFESPKSYKVEAKSHGMHYISTYHFESVDENTTKVTLEFMGKPLTFGARLMSAMFFFMQGSTKKAFQKDMAELKAHLE